MTRRSRCLLAALVLFTAACGGGDDDSDDNAGAADTTDVPSVTADGGSDAPDTSDRGTCSLEVTGDAEFSADEPATIPAVSDYWLTDEELASAAQVHDDYDERVAAGQQLLQILQVACGEVEGVLLATTDHTTRTDVPQAAATYTVLNYLDKEKPGIAAALVVPGDAIFGVTGGQLTLTRFDDAGVAGTFALDAEEISISVEPGETPKHLSITGEFDLPCWAVNAPCA